MGNCYGNVSSKVRRRNRICTIGVYGCENAGKTTVIHALCAESITGVPPTVGFKKYQLKKNPFTNINLFDVGGGERIRDIWPSYFAECHGVIFVMDANDTAHLQEIQQVLYSVISNPLINSKPVLLLLNKQDLPGALDEVDAEEQMQLVDAVNKWRTPCRIETCQATRGTGRACDKSIVFGFQWLLDRINTEYEQLQKRLKKDMTLEAERRAEKRRLAIERVRKQREEEEREGEGGEPSENSHSATNGHANGAPPPKPFKNRVLPINYEPMPKINETPESPASSHNLPPIKLPPISNQAQTRNSMDKANSARNSKSESNSSDGGESEASETLQPLPNNTIMVKTVDQQAQETLDRRKGSAGSLVTMQVSTLAGNSTVTLPPLNEPNPAGSRRSSVGVMTNGSLVKRASQGSGSARKSRSSSTDEKLEPDSAREIEPEPVPSTSGPQQMRESTTTVIVTPSVDMPEPELEPQVVSAAPAYHKENSLPFSVDGSVLSGSTSTNSANREGKQHRRKRRRLGRLVNMQRSNAVSIDSNNLSPKTDPNQSISNNHQHQQSISAKRISSNNMLPLHALPSSQPVTYENRTSYDSSFEQGYQQPQTVTVQAVIESPPEHLLISPKQSIKDVQETRDL